MEQTEILNDRVYGRILITDPLVLALMRSKPMQRIKGVKQGGAMFFIDPRYDVDRFEHSLGVYYLLTKFGASREEQMAGLLHDVPHTAFSHVVDYVFPNDRYSFHEEFFEKVIRTSDIPDILHAHGMDLEKVLRKDGFHLLDADLPNISADRLDYFLRDMVKFQLLPSGFASRVLGDLRVAHSCFVFQDVELAQMYAMLFVVADTILWRHPASDVAFDILASAIRRGFEIGALTIESLFGTDDEVFEILKKQSDSLIRDSLSELQRGVYYTFASEGEAEREVPAKIRFVDPLVESGHDVRRLSELRPSLREWLRFYAAQPKKVRVKKEGYGIML